MSTVVADMSMSLDGFIAGPDDGVGPLFDWYGHGQVEFTFPGDGRTMRVSEASAGYMRGVLNVGALICGRRLFDITGGWRGSHPVGVPCSS
jgi:hypothetical protein